MNRLLVVSAFALMVTGGSGVADAAQHATFGAQCVGYNGQTSFKYDGSGIKSTTTGGSVPLRVEFERRGAFGYAAFVAASTVDGVMLSS
jgi:hypothetical protein